MSDPILSVMESLSRLLIHALLNAFIDVAYIHMLPCAAVHVNV